MTSTATCNEGDFEGSGNADAIWNAGVNHSVATGHKVVISIAAETPLAERRMFWTAASEVEVQARGADLVSDALPPA